MTLLLWAILMSPGKNVQDKPEATIEKIEVEYMGEKVQARKLIVRSEIPIHIDKAWDLVQKPALLQFVAKGKIRFKAAGTDRLPEYWQIGKEVKVRMRVYGFIPFGGVHHLLIEDIDSDNHIIRTREWDKAAKIWNHTVRMKKIDEHKILYEDEIIIYAGGKTSFITRWAKKFYKHRQKRWQLVDDVF